jgi:DNA-binding NarL/FixJ family response regulator
LVVDDFEPFRRFVASTLQKRPELHILCEVSDGLEAVQKAEELQPDLIVLDIGLPTLTGIEAARRIRKLSPESKILFLSQESSADAVQEALGLGALGYVVKVQAGSELLPAVEAVLQGNQFVSSGLSGHWFADARARDRLRQKEALQPLAPKKAETTCSHEVHFYPDDGSSVLGFTRFIESALKAGNAAILIATESHRKSLLQNLQAHGVDSVAAIEEGRYIPLDVAETLSAFMVNGLPDPGRFSKTAADLIEAAAKAVKGEYPRVAACGEGASTLWEQGKADAAIQLEHLWDELSKTYDLDILCGYVLTSFQREQENDVYQKICAEHSSVHSRPSLNSIASTEAG